MLEFTEQELADLRTALVAHLHDLDKNMAQLEQPDTADAEAVAEIVRKQHDRAEVLLHKVSAAWVRAGMPPAGSSVSGPGRRQVEHGDVIEVPAGAEHAGSRKYRMRVDAVGETSFVGVKVRIDGGVIWQRGSTLEAAVPFEWLPKVTLHKTAR